MCEQAPRAFVVPSGGCERRLFTVAAVNRPTVLVVRMNEGECPSSAALTADGGGGTGEAIQV